GVVERASAVRRPSHAAGVQAQAHEDPRPGRRVARPRSGVAARARPRRHRRREDKGDVMNAYADPHRHIALPPAVNREILYRREWLVANGLGGYACGTIGGIPTRRYHGLLVAALPNPAGRVMMLSS